MAAEPTSPRLQAQADLIGPTSIRVAATLGIADRIAGGTRTAAGLAEGAGADPAALTRLLEHLVTIGVLSADAGGYGLTELGAELCSDHPSGLRAWLDTAGAVGRADLSLMRLEDTIRTGAPAYPLVFGATFWEDIAQDAALAASFDALMSGQLDTEAPALARAYDWGALGDLTDVGGGDGTLLAEILRAHPLLRGTVLDLEGPIAAATRRFADEDGLAERARVIAGSFLRMLAYFAGRERTLEDLAELGDSAGLRWCDTHRGAARRTVVEFAG